MTLSWSTIFPKHPIGVPLGRTPLAAQVSAQSTPLEEIVLLPIEPFEEDEVLKIVGRLNTLPMNLLQRLKNEEIQIRLFQDKLTDFPSTAHLKDVIPRGYESDDITWDEVPGIGGSKLVLVKIGHSDPGQGHGSSNLELHELAHTIQRYLLNDFYLEITLLDLWETESELLFPGKSYFISYKEEFFAEAFAMYYLNESTRKTLYKRAPQTYAFFLQLEKMY